MIVLGKEHKWQIDSEFGRIFKNYCRDDSELDFRMFQHELKLPAKHRQMLRNRKSAQKSRLKDYKLWHFGKSTIDHYNDMI